MLVVIAALEVSERVRDAGAYAGLASILGLAVLSLLYFGQARELKRLREWAGRAPERTAELQAQAAAAAVAPPQRKVAAQPVAATPAVRSPAQVPATAAGARPAGSVVPGQALTGAGAPVAAPTAAGVPATGAPAAPAAGVAQPGAAPAVPANGTPPGGGQETQAVPAVPAAAAPSPGAAAPPAPAGPPTDDVPAPLRQVSPGAQPRRRAGSEALPPPPADPPAGRGRGRTIGLVLGGLAALALVVVLATQLLGSDDTKTSSAPTTASTPDFVEPEGPTAPATPAVNPEDVRVFVLNGTRTNNLAAEVAKTLEVARFRTVGTKTAVVATNPTTTVYYGDGARRKATAVARELEVGTANVKAIEEGIAVQGPGADVVVLMGADKATP